MSEQAIWNRAIDMLSETGAFNCEPDGVDIDNRVIKLVAALLARVARLEEALREAATKLEIMGAFDPAISCRRALEEK